MVFESTASDSDGVSDPDDISVKVVDDSETGEKWLLVEWYGEDYEEAWFAVPYDETLLLSDTE